MLPSVANELLLLRRSFVLVSSFLYVFWQRVLDYADNIQRLSPS